MTPGFTVIVIVFAAVGGCVRWARANDAHGYADPTAYVLSGQQVQFPCTSTKNVYADTGRYVAKNIIATRTQVWGDRAFVLTPRFKTGVPFTVSTTRLKCQDKCRPSLTAYPCFQLHQEGDPNAIQNAVDFYLDYKGYLWVLDIGVTNTMQQPVRRSQPKIFVIDVKKDQVVKRIDLSSLVCTASRLNYIVADYGNDERPFAYVSDAATNSVIVWDLQADSGYVLSLPKSISHDCTGRRDVLYVALAHRPSGANVLYLTYLTSNRMYAIDSCNLRQGCSQGTVTDLGPKPGKIVVLGTDGGATVYFRYRGQGDVYAWDTDRAAGCFGPGQIELVRAADDKRCRLATQVAPGLHGGVLWILESNFPDYISGNVGCLGASVQLQPLVQTNN